VGTRVIAYEFVEGNLIRISGVEHTEFSSCHRAYVERAEDLIVEGAVV